MTRRLVARRCAGLVVALVCAWAPPRAAAQIVSQRGFVDARGVWYPQDAPNDTVSLVGDLLARDELFAKPAGWLQVAVGGEARANSHDQVAGDWAVDFADRGIKRPRLAVRRLSATITRGPILVEIGKQFVRWGKADILNPTDRFAPRDFLTVVDNEFLPVRAARVSGEFGRDTIEAVWVPWFTPSRTPLLDQRWTVVPPAAAGLPLVDGGAVFPGGSQTGVRWNHTADRVEYSLSVFNGFNHLPNILSKIAPPPATGGVSAGPQPPAGPEIEVTRTYPPLRTYGGDAAVPTPWVTVKGEAAYFTSSDPSTDEYIQYVVQLERQTGEWVLVGGYAGEIVTDRRAAIAFAPDRGLTDAFMGRAAYTIDANRSAAVEGAVRQNGDGLWLKGEFSQARGQHWRATLTGVLIRGDADDFLGQYRLNSYVAVALRYSF